MTVARVIVRKCEEYDPETIERIVGEGLRHLGCLPKGNVFVKPNVVLALRDNRFGKHAYTHKSVVAATLSSLTKQPDVKRIDLGEKSAVGFPTRMNYRHTGYAEEIARLRKGARMPVRLLCMDEELRDSVFVGGLVHDTLRVSRSLARADYKVYLPKLKCHCMSNMTGAVKLNVGICCDDERSVRHDFLIDEKIVDLLSIGYPDFVVMDAIEVGVGNEAMPYPRKLGLILMATNPLAIDLVGARLLGFERDDVPYLKAAVNRGYAPASLTEVSIEGDLHSVSDLDEQAKRLLPYDAEYCSWRDVDTELRRLNSPMRFYWGPYNEGGEKCAGGCVMGLKMFLATAERYAGVEAFATAKPVTFVVGKIDEEIDGRGGEVFLVGSCARAKVAGAKKVIRIDKCFTTASDLTLQIGGRLGMPALTKNPEMMFEFVTQIARAAFQKIFSGRYFQDIGQFVGKKLQRRI